MQSHSQQVTIMKNIASVIVFLSIVAQGNTFAGLREELKLVGETCTSPYPALAERGRALLQNLYEIHGAKSQIRSMIRRCGITELTPPRQRTPNMTARPQEPGGVRGMEPQLPKE